MTTLGIGRTLQKYPCIKKYYGQYITSFLKEKHPLISLIFNEWRYLDLLNGWLEKLDSTPDITHLIKKSRNPTDFFNIMSEFKVASILIDKVGKFKIIVPKKSSPEFEIEMFGRTITIEVKRIGDKRETRKGKVKYNPASAGMSYEFEDEHTIYNSIKESIIEKKQYYPNIPHIILFDCSSASSIKESDFEDVLYHKKDKFIPLMPTRAITGKFIGYGHPEYKYDGVFYKKIREENYSCLSGIAAIFESYRELRTNSSKEPRIVFFRNPNADLNINEEILSSLGMKIYKIKEG